jgi:hypothetical protein
VLQILCGTSGGCNSISTARDSSFDSGKADHFLIREYFWLEIAVIEKTENSGGTRRKDLESTDSHDHERKHGRSNTYTAINATNL